MTMLKQIAILLLFCSVATAYEDFSTYAQTDPSSQITLAGVGNVTWQLDQLNRLTGDNSVLTKEWAPGTTWSWAGTFTMYSEAVDATPCLGVAVFASATGSVTELIAAQADFVVVEMIGAGGLMMKVALYEDGVVADSTTSSGAAGSGAWTLSVSADNGIYTISGVYGGAEKFADTTLYDGTPNSYTHFSTCSWIRDSYYYGVVSATNFTLTDSTDTNTGPNFYVGSAATGDGTGVDRDNIMLYTTGILQLGPGETLWFQPGDGYAVSINTANIPDYGTPGAHIGFKRDPTTTVGLPSGWKDVNDLPMPDPADEVILPGIRVGTASAVDQYVDFNGLNVVNGYIGTVDGTATYAGYVEFDGCRVVGADSVDQADTETDPVLTASLPEYMFRFYGATAHHITVKNCRFDYGKNGPMFSGAFGDGIVFEDCVVGHVTDSLYKWWSDTNNDGTWRILRDSRLFHATNGAWMISESSG